MGCERDRASGTGFYCGQHYIFITEERQHLFTAGLISLWRKWKHFNQSLLTIKINPNLVNRKTNQTNPDNLSKESLGMQNT